MITYRRESFVLVIRIPTQAHCHGVYFAIVVTKCGCLVLVRHYLCVAKVYSGRSNCRHWMQRVIWQVCCAEFLMSPPEIFCLSETYQSDTRGLSPLCQTPPVPRLSSRWGTVPRGHQARRWRGVRTGRTVSGLAQTVARESARGRRPSAGARRWERASCR